MTEKELNLVRKFVVKAFNIPETEVQMCDDDIEIGTRWTIENWDDDDGHERLLVIEYIPTYGSFYEPPDYKERAIGTFFNLRNALVAIAASEAELLYDNIEEE